MNYTLHYDRLIQRARNRTIDGYYETHHVVPKCLGGSNDRANLVHLTPEEHFVAHQLLVKIYPDSRDLLYAAQMMTFHNSSVRNNNKLFGWLRRRMATDFSVRTKNYIRDHGHPRGMLGKNHTEDHKERLSILMKEMHTAKFGIPVFVYNLDGTFLKAFESFTLCAEYLKTSPSNVKYTAQGKFSHCKGAMLFLEDRGPTTTSYAKPTSPLRGRPKTEEHKSNIRASKRS